MPHGQVGFDLTLKEGQISVLMGPNGVGKTSFFQYLKNHEQTYFPHAQVSFMDQLPLTPLGELRGIDLFEMLLDLYPNRMNFDSLSHYPLLDEFQFREKIKRPIRLLSGGENQLLKLLSIFALRADFIFLDEPFNHLDKDRLKLVINVLNKFKSQGKSFLVIDHREETLNLYADVFFQMQKENKLDGIAHETFYIKQVASMAEGLNFD